MEGLVVICAACARWFRLPEPAAPHLIPARVTCPNCGMEGVLAEAGQGERRLVASPGSTPPGPPIPEAPPAASAPIEDLAQQAFALLGRLREGIQEIFQQPGLATAKLARIEDLKAELLRDFEGLYLTYDRRSQEREAALLQELARLREFRDLAVVLRRAVIPAFSPGAEPRGDREPSA